MHTGATQASGLTRLYSNVWDEIDLSLNRKLYETYLGSMDNVRTEPSLRKFALMSSTLSSGSIEGVDLPAVEPQNMGVACGFLADGSKVL